MGKYLDLQNKVFSVFDSNTWKAEAIKTYPQDTIASSSENGYIRVSIIAGQPGINRTSISGVCIIDIFVAAGKGPTSYHAIADKLDSYLENKTLNALLSSNTVQFGNSTLVPKGEDKANPQLTKAQYTIPFNLFGVL